ncbi:MAG: inorganic diphosphatase [Rickettsiaceae bacterium]
MYKMNFRQNSEEFYVIVEIPMNNDPVKYEFKKEVGMITVDRFMQTAMYYPCNYGFIPNTLSGDGDPVDVLVVSRYPVIPGSVIKSRPIGVLIMEDESGVDEKIIAVPVSKVDCSFDDVQSISDVDQMLIKRIRHFFENYKALENGKWVKIVGFEDKAQAVALINSGFVNFSS